jgi:hypothetical protein
MYVLQFAIYKFPGFGVAKVRISIAIIANGYADLTIMQNRLEAVFDKG